ncbi:MAG: hypothetical protein EAZ20_03455 [Bacteroidetes bacterium]|nr:MAG: hypothetical protein EAZ20_03455 [Bacteroidota bacterium]
MKNKKTLQQKANIEKCLLDISQTIELKSIVSTNPIDQKCVLVLENIREVAKKTHDYDFIEKNMIELQLSFSISSLLLILSNIDTLGFKKTIKIFRDTFDYLMKQEQAINEYEEKMLPVCVFDSILYELKYKMEEQLEKLETKLKKLA